MNTDNDRIGCFFLDSGAHSLYNAKVAKSRAKDPYAFYKSDEFWEYVDGYAAFVKEHHYAIDHYANVDVIFRPEESWQVLKYLENEHGLRPIPVIHFGTDIKWLRKHLDAGYDYIGIGGRAQGSTKAAYIQWADQVFGMICDTPDRLPSVRTHGFVSAGAENRPVGGA